MNQLFAKRALLPQGWTQDVLLSWDAQGVLTQVTASVEATANSEQVNLLIPGMPNLHSHAFQRAMAGLTEYRANPSDSFWSWRSLMYDFAQRLTPEAMHAIACQLYTEMLKAGYTSVCEFHYLHHDAGGKPYANPAEMSECLIAAAQDTGIGLTLLPVMYQYSGFGSKPAHVGQARFINSPDWIMNLLSGLQTAHPQHPGLRYGIAPHSLRAVSPESLQQVVGMLHAWDSAAPVHIHIAEQEQEVRDSLTFSGLRPVEWLLQHLNPDERWCLVHATHMSEQETAALASSGAIAGICPTTEANLGDGIFNGMSYLQQGGHWGIGSDSHVSISLREELRMFEYSQRLLHKQRNVLANQESSSVGANLYEQALAGGAQASARPIGELSMGKRADFLVLDEQHPDLYGKEGDSLLDSLIFCNHATTPILDVIAGGKWLVRQGRHSNEETTAEAYRVALGHLLAK